MMQTRILIIEDHVLVREALALTLAQVGEGVHCQQASNATDALALLEADPDCDLLVVDLMLPEINGFSLLGVIAKRFPDVPALVVSALDDRESVHRAMKAGASGFVSKASPSNTLIEAVRTILAGGVFTPEVHRQSASTAATATGAPARPSPSASSSPRRRAGCSNWWPRANQTGISPSFSVCPRVLSRCMCRRSLRALGVTSRAQALLLMTRAGLRV
jgi:DNA-binding NarL/FixJ family response regulator